jgi:dienelactone hydrolase
MHQETLAYEADGLTMLGALRVPSGPGPLPAVLIFPDAFGRGHHAIDRAERLAEEGYVALACDLHGDARTVDSLDEARGLLDVLRKDPARLLARAERARAALAARPEVAAARMAAIGYCFGGTMALELARSGAPLPAVVGFHAGLTAMNGPTPQGRITGKVLACIGADDPGVPAEQRQAFEAEMRAAGADWQLHVYGGVLHSFTDPGADARNMPQMARYDARADARSWAAMMGIFAEAGL